MSMRACLSFRSAALLLFLGSAIPVLTACTDALAPAISADEPEMLTFRAAPLPEQTPAPKPPARGAASQPVATKARAATPALPEVSYVCPMPQDADVLEDKAGKCPKCGMELTAVRIVDAYSCITHNAIVQEKPGSCPIDKRALVPIVASLYWACADSLDKHEINPGNCADGKPRLRKVERRAHGDHNPRHGGMLFMASDKWHHLEGTYPSAGLFRVFFYDDFTRPMAPKGFTARAVFKDASDKEIGSIALKPGRISNTMEATLPGQKLPIAMQLRVKFTPKDPESGFDFAFSQYTNEPAAAPRTPVMTNNQAPAPARPAAAAAPAQAGLQGIAPDAQTNTVGGTFELGPAPLPARVLPTDPKELLTLLTNDSNEVKSLLDQGMFTAVWKPAADAKDDALALGDHAKEFPETRRVALDSAVRRLMLAAWQLDSFGDLGDKTKLMRAYNQFAQAVEEVKAVYATR